MRRFPVLLASLAILLLIGPVVAWPQPACACQCLITWPRGVTHKAYLNQTSDLVVIGEIESDPVWPEGRETGRLRVEKVLKGEVKSVWRKDGIPVAGWRFNGDECDCSRHLYAYRGRERMYLVWSKQFPGFYEVIWQEEVDKP
jgi:hypothetical protein